MPRTVSKTMRVLNSDQLKQVVKVCQNIRDKTLLHFLVDTGLRTSEACSLNWSDIDIKTGIVNVQETKNKKSRSIFVGIRTRRLLLKYRRTVSHNDSDSLFGLKKSGLRMVINRLSKKSDIKFSPHDLRRTFATLSLKAGMSVFHLQSLLGHSSLEMTRRYVQMLDDDLVEAHRLHGPIDTFLNK